MDTYQKLEFIHFALQEAINLIDETNPELEHALAFVEDLRELYFSPAAD